MKIAVILGLLIATGTSHAGPQITQVPESRWSTMTDAERISLQSASVVNIVSDEAIGVIIDAQTINTSDPGSDAGSALGAAIGGAAYIDNAFKGPNWNYSAKSHLGVSILGAMIGSSLNRPAQSNFTTRYTIRTLSGRITNVTQSSSSAFRETIGICVTVPDLRIAEQALCAGLLPPAAPAPIAQTIALPIAAKSTTPISATRQAPVTPAEFIDEEVSCKLGIAAPIRTSREKCLFVQGEVVN